MPGAGGKGGKGGRGGGGGGDTRKKAVLISGPPGIGKTTTVHMVCAKMGVRVVGAIHPPIRSDPPIVLLVLAAIVCPPLLVAERNASDVRSKGALDAEASPPARR